MAIPAHILSVSPPKWEEIRQPRFLPTNELRPACHVRLITQVLLIRVELSEGAGRDRGRYLTNTCAKGSLEQKHVQLSRLGKSRRLNQAQRSDLPPFSFSSMSFCERILTASLLYM